MPSALKYQLYELSVQSPETHINWFVSIYRDLRGKYAKRLREDFCGTFQLSCAWVKRNRNNFAMGLDLDPEPLSYGSRNNRAKLSANQKKRLQILKADVLIPTSQKSDFIIACNFSFFIFMERTVLLKYFKSCLKSLAPQGMILLEMAGGPGMIATMREQKTLSLKKKKFTYIWDQKSFDPITHEARYAIHFKLPEGKTLKNQFTYHWRLWTLPEVRDLLKEAGFSKTAVYWETSHRGKGTGEFIQTEKGDNAYAWIAYVVGLK